MRKKKCNYPYAYEIHQMLAANQNVFVWCPTQHIANNVYYAFTRSTKGWKHNKQRLMSIDSNGRFVRFFRRDDNKYFKRTRGVENYKDMYL